MKLTHYLILAAAALSFGACNGDSSDYKTQYIDIVSLDSSNDNGSVLTYRLVDDSPLITLTTSQAFSSDQVGKRIVIIYQYINDENHGESGAVQLMNAGSTFGGGASPKSAIADTLSNWFSDEIDVMQAWRSGKYLNLTMQISTTTNPEKFECYLDENTENNDYPELHVVFTKKAGYDGNAYNFFGSYDISDIWNRQSVKGLKLFYNGDSGQSVTIEKEIISIKPVE